MQPRPSITIEKKPIFYFFRKSDIIKMKPNACQARVVGDYFLYGNIVITSAPKAIIKDNPSKLS